MINHKTNYIIISIRLFIYVTTFLFSNILAEFFKNELDILLFTNIGIMVVFFSLISVFLSKFLSPIYIFYIQAIFDLIITSFLISNTGYLDSPYILFYAIIIIYMSFYDGFNGGISGVLSVLIIFSGMAIMKNDIFITRYYNFKYLLIFTEYLLSFLLIVFLVSLLNKKYKKQVLESESYKNKLLELANIHSAILENIDFGVILIDPNGIILSANSYSRKILEVDELIGNNLKNIFNIDKKSNLINFKNKYIGFKFTPFKDPNGVINGELLIFQDVSEREQLKQKLEEERRLADLGRFSSVLAHEIKNPLGAIKGALQIQFKNFSPDNKLVQIIFREISRLELFLGNMLIITKGRSDKNNPLKIKHILDDFIFYIKTSGIFENLSFNIQIDDNFTLIIDENEFKQIIWNLLLNSYEIKHDATITIYTIGNLLIYQDNGPGIDRSILHSIGKPFFTTKSSGTGLGFYAIIKICEKNNLRYKVYSNDEFSGFKIEFSPTKE
ncbi:MAG: ATP-binding protein [Calditerrivibrio sp.]|nr:ATP-binding protein [Calditerrivibrio sp.]